MFRFGELKSGEMKKTQNVARWNKFWPRKVDLKNETKK